MLAASTRVGAAPAATRPMGTVEAWRLEETHTGLRLVGAAWENPRFPDHTLFQTSTIVAADLARGEVITRSGGVYRLGLSSRYTAWERVFAVRRLVASLQEPF